MYFCRWERTKKKKKRRKDIEPLRRDVFLSAKSGRLKRVASHDKHVSKVAICSLHQDDGTGRVNFTIPTKRALIIRASILTREQ